MRIGIDARPLIEKKTGIGYYLQYLLENVLENDKENQYFLFSDRKVYFESEKYKNLHVVIDNESSLKRTIWYLLKSNQLCKKYDIDVFWGTQHIIPLGLKKQKTVLTMHDLVAFDFKETMSTYNKIINKLFIPNSLKKADKIITVSKSTRERLNYHFPKIDKNKVKVIYEDVVISNDLSKVNTEKFDKLGVRNKEYLMFLGTIEPRKNLKTLIKAFENIYNETGLKLIICGKYGWKCEEEKAMIEEHKDKIVFLNYITEEEKSYLMKNSFLFVFPSIYEGFGLPVLEAMRNGVAVIVANNTSLTELVEMPELKFDTLNSNDLEKKIIELYNNKDLYEDAIKYCNERQAYFSWDKISKEYIYEITRGW
ncbi:glycosyltransferase family 1 protein [Paraclostridium benzoelyticum]|uniref:glycosyltransferase family 4 protein n=1 Tax=Paraclostridium benzoelyticum TaxID=1629550 RepID=UPI0031CD267F